MSYKLHASRRCTQGPFSRVFIRWLENLSSFHTCHLKANSFGCFTIECTPLFFHMLPVDKKFYIGYYSLRVLFSKSWCNKEQGNKKSREIGQYLTKLSAEIIPKNALFFMLPGVIQFFHILTIAPDTTDVVAALKFLISYKQPCDNFRIITIFWRYANFFGSAGLFFTFTKMLPILM